MRWLLMLLFVACSSQPGDPQAPQPETTTEPPIETIAPIHKSAPNTCGKIAIVGRRANVDECGAHEEDDAPDHNVLVNNEVEEMVW